MRCSVRFEQSYFSMLATSSQTWLFSVRIGLAGSKKRSDNSCSSECDDKTVRAPIMETIGQAVQALPQTNAV